MKGRNIYKGRRCARRGPVPIVVVMAIVLLIGVAVFKGVKSYLKDRFAKDTIIQGVDCSYLSVDEAMTKISDTLGQEQITLVFEESQYELQGKDFGLCLSNSEELSAILENQKNSEDPEHIYTLTSSIIASDEKTCYQLLLLSELQTENMVKAEDAYIQIQDDGTLAIKSEVRGSEIDFDEALLYCYGRLMDGDTTIDFTSLVKSPEVLSTDKELNETVDTINKILSAVINFQLEDGSIYTLDKEITKTWVTKSESGNYYVDFNNVDSFVEELDKRAQQSIGSMMFTPTDSTPIQLPGKLKLEVDADQEAQLIAEQLQASGTYTRKPIYKEGFGPENLLDYIEVDLTRQMVWMYKNGECILSTPCVTGKPSAGDDTPPGVFYLTYKTKDAVLRGYNSDGSRYASHVKYWMPFNGGIGFHDASWQSSFGGLRYLTHGSHGCVNLPLEAARTMYENITYTMPIIVYCS